MEFIFFSALVSIMAQHDFTYKINMEIIKTELKRELLFSNTDFIFLSVSVALWFNLNSYKFNYSSTGTHMTFMIAKLGLIQVSL